LKFKLLFSYLILKQKQCYGEASLTSHTWIELISYNSISVKESSERMRGKKYDLILGPNNECKTNMGNATLVTIKNMKVGFCTDLVVFAWNTIIMQKANAFILRNAFKLPIWRVYHNISLLECLP